MSLVNEPWWAGFTERLKETSLDLLAEELHVDPLLLDDALREASHGGAAEGEPWWPEVARLHDSRPIRELARRFGTNPRRLRRALARSGLRAAGAAIGSSGVSLLRSHLALLGKEPDHLIAAMAGVIPEVVQGERRRLGIPPFRPNVSNVSNGCDGSPTNPRPSCSSSSVASQPEIIRVSSRREPASQRSPSEGPPRPSDFSSHESYGFHGARSHGPSSARESSWARGVHRLPFTVSPPTTSPVPPGKSNLYGSVGMPPDVTEHSPDPSPTEKPTQSRQDRVAGSRRRLVRPTARQTPRKVSPPEAPSRPRPARKVRPQIRVVVFERVDEPVEQKAHGPLPDNDVGQDDFSAQTRDPVQMGASDLVAPNHAGMAGLEDADLPPEVDDALFSGSEPVPVEEPATRDVGATDFPPRPTAIPTAPEPAAEPRAEPGTTTQQLSFQAREELDPGTESHRPEALQQPAVETTTPQLPAGKPPLPEELPALADQVPQPGEPEELAGVRGASAGHRKTLPRIPWLNDSAYRSIRMLAPAGSIGTSGALVHPHGWNRAPISRVASDVGSTRPEERCHVESPMVADPHSIGEPSDLPGQPERCASLHDPDRMLSLVPDGDAHAPMFAWKITLRQQQELVVLSKSLLGAVRAAASRVGREALVGASARRWCPAFTVDAGQK